MPHELHDTTESGIEPDQENQPHQKGSLAEHDNLSGKIDLKPQALTGANPSRAIYAPDQPKTPAKPKRRKKQRKQATPRNSASSSRNVTTWELNELGQVALDTLRARYPDKKTLKELVSYALAVAVGMMEASPPINFGTLSEAEMMRVLAAIARLDSSLKGFRADLIQAGKDPDNSDDIATLLEAADTHLAETADLRRRMAKLAKVPTAFDTVDLEALIDLKAFFEDARNATQEPAFGYFLKLLTVFLP